jgi:hypothetical protein
MLDVKHVYVVWGPTAEWADGSGPLATFLDESAAEQYIEWEVQEILAAELENSWTYNQVEFTYVKQTLEQVMPEEYVTVAVNDWDEDELLDFLNQR